MPTLVPVTEGQATIKALLEEGTSLYESVQQEGSKLRTLQHGVKAVRAHIRTLGRKRGTRYVQDSHCGMVTAAPLTVSPLRSGSDATLAGGGDNLSAASADVGIDYLGHASLASIPRDRGATNRANRASIATLATNASKRYHTRPIVGGCVLAQNTHDLTTRGCLCDPLWDCFAAQHCGEHGIAGHRGTRAASSKAAERPQNPRWSGSCSNKTPSEIVAADTSCR